MNRSLKKKMVKALLTTFAFCLPFAYTAMAQTGMAFPNMECINLDGKPVALPSALKGKKALLCLAYSQKAEQKLQGWLDASIHKFILRSSEHSLIPEDPYDIHTFFIAMYTGANKNAAGASVKQIKTNVDVALHPYIITYKGELEPYKTILKLDIKDDPYIFVVNETGKILYAYNGAYSEDELNKIDELLEPND